MLLLLLGVALLLLGSIYLWPNVVLRCLNRLFSSFSDDRAVFDTQHLQWAKALRENHHLIREEYEAFCRTHYQPTANQLVPEEATNIVGRTNSHWRVVYLRFYQRNSEAVMRHQFPVTMSLLEGFGCCSAFFSVLEPGVEILPHTGYYKGVLRYHLGLIVPPKSKTLTGKPACHLQVDGKLMEWTVGEDILFDDCRWHSAANHSPTQRVVLLLDIKRPLPFFLGAINHMAIAIAKYVPQSSRIFSRINKWQQMLAK